MFYSSPVKDAFVLAKTPPAISSYLFSSKPTVHVYASVLEAYKASDWKEYNLVGDLDDYEEITAVEAPRMDSSILSGQSETPTYDLFGRRVTVLKPGTIYIRGGKKFITR